MTIDEVRKRVKTEYDRLSSDLKKSREDWLVIERDYQTRLANLATAVDEIDEIAKQ